MRKYYLFIVILVFSCLACYSQNQLDPQPLNINWGNYFKPDASEFPLIWNWGSIGYPLDEAMDIRYWHNGTEQVNSNFHCPNQMRISQPPNNIANGPTDTNLLNCQAIIYEPTITVDTTMNFKPRYGDSLGSVFGFRYRNFAVGDTVSSGENFHRFILSKSKLIYVNIFN